MAWIYLIIAGIFETVWAVALKYSDSFTKLWPSIITIIAMALSIYLLAVALRSLDLGTAYAIWTGIGAIGAILYGIIIFGESKSLLRIIFLIMILGGIIGLKVTSTQKNSNKSNYQLNDHAKD